MKKEIQISIHTSRAGCDVIPVNPVAVVYGISMHTSRAGCDGVSGVHGADLGNFNSHIPYGM